MTSMDRISLSGLRSLDSIDEYMHETERFFLINQRSMSKKPIGKLWTDTQIQLSRLITSETVAPKGFDSERQANDYVRRLFVRYNEILKKLDDIYGTLVHPQKRRILRILLDGLVGRLVELKRELIRFDSCEYTYFEDLALDQNKTLVIVIEWVIHRTSQKAF